MTTPLPATRFADVSYESLRMLPPINDYLHIPLVSLKEAIKPIARYFSAIDMYATLALHGASLEDGLTLDESASIYLYTISFKNEPSLSQLLNQNLRDSDRSKLKPWVLFLKLLFTALQKLPSKNQVLYRAAPGENMFPKYSDKAKVIWWGISSCFESIRALEDQVMGKTGVRTLFIIDAQNGKSIRNHSCMKEEQEIVLSPGTGLEVVSRMCTQDLYIIHLKEVVSAFDLLNASLLAESMNSERQRTAFYSDCRTTLPLKIYAKPYDEFKLDDLKPESTEEFPGNSCDDQSSSGGS